MAKQEASANSIQNSAQPNPNIKIALYISFQKNFLI
jgi:hypothetical protein